MGVNVKKKRLNLKHAACFHCLKQVGRSRRFAKDSDSVLNFRGLFLRMVTYMMPFTTLHGRRAALALSLTALSCGSFCLLSAAVPAAVPAAKKTKEKNAAPPSMAVVGSGMTLTLPDPKLPGTGKLLYYLRAAAADGHSDPDGSFQGSLTKLWVRLYQKGVPSAVLTAPKAQGGGTSKAVVITGMGGVVVKSLTEPGTILTADTVVWRSALNKIVATGHVYYHNSKTGATVTGPVMNADTKLRTWSLTSGIHARMPY